MNNLESYIRMFKLDPTDTMNRLQAHGIVSDNALWPQDVGNCGAALAWLRDNPEKKHG